MKKLPTFTLSECKHKGTCATGYRYYADIFGEDTQITVADIINVGRDDVSAAESFLDLMWLNNWDYWNDQSSFKGGVRGLKMNLLTKDQIDTLKNYNINKDSVFDSRFDFFTEGYEDCMVDIFTIFLIENGYDVSARREI